jgi:hypothetical protein
LIVTSRCILGATCLASWSDACAAGESSTTVVAVKPIPQVALSASVCLSVASLAVRAIARSAVEGLTGEGISDELITEMAFFALVVTSPELLCSARLTARSHASLASIGFTLESRRDAKASLALETLLVSCPLSLRSASGAVSAIPNAAAVRHTLV